MTLSESISLKLHDVISLVGGGGKTNILYTLARENKTKTALFTTSTRMNDPIQEKSPFNKIELRQTLPLSPSDSLISLEKAIYCCKEIDGIKVRGFSLNDFNKYDSKQWDFTVIEADGAATKPLKIPNSFEPVIPSQTTKIIAVIGLDVFGKPAGPQWIHRFNLLQKKWTIKEGAPINEDLLFNLLTEEDGLFQYSSHILEKIIIFNKKDCLDEKYISNYNCLCQRIKSFYAPFSKIRIIESQLLPKREKRIDIL